MVRLATALVVVLSLAAAAPERVSAQDPSSGATASGGDVNHAAIVIDTGDGNVRKLCLAFPEAEISGIEALRRVDTRPHRFETFNGKGSGVCMLCGVGCESGDCFCDKSNYWAYHRAGPGDTRYQTSSLGASSTTVRNGDVEGWKWGPGTAPVKTTVSEVCNVAEPPARTAAAPTTTASPPTTGAESPSTTAGPSAAEGAPAPSPTSVPAPTPAARPGPPTTGSSTPVAPVAAPSEVAAATSPEGAQEAPAGPAAVEARRSLRAEDPAAAPIRRTTDGGTSAGELAGLAAFTAVLGGLLLWRSRLRRANVRRARTVR